MTLALSLLLCAWLMTVSAHADDSMYLFEVGTGAATGDESKIDFFIITYTTAGSKGATVSKFLFPNKDAWTNTYAMAREKAGDAQEKADAETLATYGYSAAELDGKEKKLFQAYSVDQYLFTTPEPIAEVKRVQVFAGDSGNWSCTCLRVFQVDELRGLRRWNTGSADCYIDFRGVLLAEAKSRQNIEWANDRLVSTDQGKEISLTNSGFSEEYAAHRLQDNSQKTLALRIDFADVYGGGLEALAPMSAANNSLTDMGLAETMALTLYYTDLYGVKRAARVPGVLNAAAYTAGLLGGGSAASIGQQGESMVVGIFLPDYSALVRDEGITVTLGATEAETALDIVSQEGLPEGNGSKLRASRRTLSEKDTAAFVTLAVYSLEKTQITASVNQSSGAVEYVFSGSSDKPIFYQPVSSVSGNALRKGANRVSLTAYENGKNLAPKDNTERYLFEVVTDSVEGAGTREDINLHITYTDLEGAAKDSGTLSMRELSRDFNGWWYGSPEEDIGYYKGVSTGQTLRFFVPLSKVMSIENVEVWIDKGNGGDGDWQMSDLSISTVSYFDKRSIKWQAFSADGVSCELYYERNVTATEIYRYRDTTEGPVLIQKQDDKAVEVGPTRTSGGGNGGSGGVEVTNVKAADWSQIRYSMDFKQASQDLGFGKDRFHYAVTIHVGGEADASAADGDCGSKNLFYFRLIFKEGNSGFVLANQQLASDGFVAGATQTIVISTNQDYGNVEAVQIIPEQSSENNELFDKLMIRSIDIKRMDNAALVPVWSINNVGWIGIDFQDSSQLQSVTGMSGRSASQLTRSFLVDSSSYEASFMVAIQTGSYNDGDPQFEGNLSARITYDSDSPSKGIEEISDVTRLMYNYMNRTPLAMPDSVGGKTVSDPSLMFRANHTDRFIFSLSEVKSIRSIDFYVTSAVGTVWNISNVSLFQVNGTGTLIRNSVGEYEQVYQKGEELELLACGDSQNVPAYRQVLEPYNAAANKELPTITVNFPEKPVKNSPGANQWRSVMTREPVSQNDTLNLFLYPQEIESVDMDNPPVASIQYTEVGATHIQESTGDLNRALYKDKPVFYATQLNASRFGVFNSVQLYNGRGKGINGTVRGVLQQVRSGVVINTWYLSGNGNTDPGGITLQATSAPSTRRQRVQLQLGMDTPETVLTPVTDGNMTDVDNLAVALWYRTDDPAGMELRSPYVYLTDQADPVDGKSYSQIRPGQVIDLTFAQKNVGEIIGVSVVGAGNVTGSVESVRIVDQTLKNNSDEVIGTEGTYCLTNRMSIEKVPSRIQVTQSDAVKLLSIDFTTGKSTDSMSAGTDMPVRMALGYYDSYGNLLEQNYEDIRPYLIKGETGFRAGMTSTVRMLVDDLEELRWIELETYRENGETDQTDQADQSGAKKKKSMWILEEISAYPDEGKSPLHRTLNAQLIEGEVLKLSMADIALRSTVEVGEPTTGNRSWKAAENVENLIIKSGDSVRIRSYLEGSTEPLFARVESYDVSSGASGTASLADTRGYTEASIAQKVSDAKTNLELFQEALKNATTDSGKAAANRGIQAATAEAQMWAKVKPEVGEWSVIGNSEFEKIQKGENGILGTDLIDESKWDASGATGSELLTLSSGDVLLFTPPRNYAEKSDSYRCYRITVYSSENSAARFELIVTVAAETDPTTKSQTSLSQEMIDAQKELSDTQNENTENLVKIINELTNRMQSLQGQLDALNGASTLGG